MRELFLSFLLLVIVFADNRNTHSQYVREDTHTEGGHGHGFRVPSYPGNDDDDHTHYRAPVNRAGTRRPERYGPANDNPRRPLPPLHRPEQYNHDAPHVVIPDLDLSQGEILGNYPTNEDIYELAHKLGYRGDLDEGAYAPKGTLNGAKFSEELKSLLSANDYDINAHEESYATGYIGGKNYGEKEGYEHGEQRGYHEGNERGYEDGHREGFHVGQDEGFDSGQEAGAVIGFVGSYQLAVQKGIRIGMRKGYRDAYHRGYGDGSRDGYTDGWKEGLTKALEAVKSGRNPEELLEELAENPHQNPRPHHPVEVPPLNEEEFFDLPHRIRHDHEDHHESRRVRREPYGEHHPLHNTTIVHHNSTHHNMTHHNATSTPVRNTTATPSPVSRHQYGWDDDEDF